MLIIMKRIIIFLKQKKDKVIKKKNIKKLLDNILIFLRKIKKINEIQILKDDLDIKSNTNTEAF